MASTTSISCSSLLVTFFLLFSSIILPSCSAAPRRRPPPSPPTRSRSSPPPPPPTRSSPPPPIPSHSPPSYYLLVVQWPPSFCRNDENPRGCTTRNPTDVPEHFTLHGFWPKTSDDNDPPIVGEAYDFNKMPKDIQTRANLKEYWPDLNDKLTAEFFWIRQWKKHGIRSGMLQEDYFKLALELFEVVRKYWEDKVKIQAGSTIDLSELDKDLVKLGVPQFKCNNYNKRQQLYEMRFNWTKEDTFELNYDTSDCTQMINFPRSR